ncbi:two-component system phosphate regulon sensor histidine kinase PhoR [Microbacterium sp. SORGH_AS428]|uniref:sensor histidine kinase n=1 Tax=Microbacterium sp. SORGH_AS_0428 TaxID=3041788 RepID=UPI00285CFEC3|nr:HAMP domain-containing sensor histidine kinase [Microbacterium sp. SORGH_AS_0428]MDR6200899.1 two-component system phosphate regulon sensor histidine kinase PhoR [Microbacterium sp. SORGH_AS_0428]
MKSSIVDRVRGNLTPQYVFAGTMLALTAVVAAATPHYVTPGGAGVAVVGVIVVTAAAIACRLTQALKATSQWWVFFPLADLALWGYARMDLLPSLPVAGITVFFPLMWIAFAFPLWWFVPVAVVFVFMGLLPQLAGRAGDVGAAQAHWQVGAFCVLALVVCAFCATAAAWTRRKEAALAESRARINTLFGENVAGRAILQAIADATSDAIMLIDRDDVATLSNAGADRLMQLAGVRGWTRSSAPAIRFTDGRPFPVDRSFLDALHAGIYADGVPLNVGEPSEQLTLQFSARDIFTLEGERIGALIIAHDVTALTSAITARDEFLNTVGHELRTPLTVMLGYADLLADALEEQAPDLFAAVMTIVKAGERQLAVIDQIMSANRTHIPRHSRRVDVLSVLRSVASRYPTARIIPARVTGGELRIHADPDDLDKAVTAIVANAVIYGPPASPVEIAVRRDDGHVVIEVSDRGATMTEQERDQAFDLFFRASYALKHAIPGVGLGLTFARKLIEANGGTVRLDGRADGNGTMATIIFPEHAPSL